MFKDKIILILVLQIMILFTMELYDGINFPNVMCLLAYGALMLCREVKE